MRNKNSDVCRGLLVAGLVGTLLGSCGYSEEELDEAYRAGHRAGMIWCKREDARETPELTEQLLTEWERGWSESTAIQCPNKR